jgi:DNA polymerase
VQKRTREILEIVSAARALVEVERDLGADALPVPEIEPAAAGTGPPPAARRQDPALDPESTLNELQKLESAVARCTACELHRNRTQTVFGRGAPGSEILFVGEGPGVDEDRQGIPFVGQAGKLLDRMIEAMGYEREAVYICNVVKCRPPGNRTPLPEEADSCERFLTAQIDLVSPEVIVALGKCAALNLGVAGEAGPWRGRWGQWRGIPVMPTYHPAFLLRSPRFKRVVWEDLQEVMERLGRRSGRS